jgi:hypothetical protein
VRGSLIGTWGRRALRWSCCEILPGRMQVGVNAEAVGTCECRAGWK